MSNDITIEVYKECDNCIHILDPSKPPCRICYRGGVEKTPTMWEPKPSEQEVKIIMNDEGRLFVEDEYGNRYLMVPWDKNGVFAK